ncbi:hypothetical protein PACTADRAFT_51237 [Pachysolen tannophilus NRRL Y-2460]|uniref:HTH APSES-type domain-containing protein n=1 Tax=Pachysolen tannophilus NRRL Y-2460 TaxID=669874 RepID=A0A1E4TRN9_PACTA|nr:hypothetical protein PACTADRAFT_51237 [Pachysolen tannophilus NRRL Y-2460]
MDIHQQIYIATYSNVDVFESVINGIPLMRRCSDDWVNSTQILRIADFPKAQRTKILEREVQIHTHQKIQGGYGRFQGTWIPLEVARKIALNYGIDENVAPILYYNPEDNQGIPLTRKGKPGKNLGANNEINPSPTKKRKENPKKENKKLNKKDTTPQKRGVTAELQHQYQLHIQQQQQQQQAQQQQQQQQQQAQVHQAQMHISTNTQMIPQNLLPPQFVVSSSIPTFPQQQNDFRTNQIQVQQQFVMAAQFQQKQAQQQFQIQQHHHQAQYPQDMQYPQMQHATQAEIVDYQQHNQKYSQGSLSTTENWSQDDRRNSDTSLSSNASLHLKEDLHQKQLQQQQQQQQQQYNHFPQEHFAIAENMQVGDMSFEDQHQNGDEEIEEEVSIYTTQLLDFFEKDNAEIPSFLYNIPSDFDVNEQIDDEGHTPLHWASALANLPIIELLVKNNADPLIPNKKGINCLSKMISFNNSFDLQNFPRILELFKTCLVVPDCNSRIPLHYLMELAKFEKNFKSLKYYVTEIFKFAKMNDENQPQVDENKKLLKILINHQDISGDSSLHICARIGNREFIKMLLSNGADINLCNLSGQSCRDLISIEILEEFQRDIMLKNRGPGSLSKRGRKKKNSPKSLSIDSNSNEEDLELELEKNKMRVENKVFVGNTDEENKENIFFNRGGEHVSVNNANVEANAEANNGNSDNKVSINGSVGINTTNKKTSSSSSSSRRKTRITMKSLSSIRYGFPDLFTSLEEKIDDEIKQVDDEYQYNLSVYEDLKNETHDLMFQNSKIIHKVLSPEEIIIESPNSSSHSVQSKNLAVVSEKLNQMDEKVELKAQYLHKIWERSQSLQLAKLAHKEEEAICDEEREQGADEDESKLTVGNVKAAIELTLLQLRRKKLVDDIIRRLSHNANFNNESDVSKHNKNIEKYKRLISLACGIDDINEELLDGIQNALFKT